MNTAACEPEVQRLSDLVQIEEAVWAELRAAVRSPAGSHAWRSAVLATADEADGPQARTIVLRDLRHQPRQLIFYTDARAAKVRELRTDDRAQLVCWSASLGWQLRLRCSVRIETDGLDVTARWAGIRHRRGAQDYLAPLPPGSRLGDGAEAPLQCLSPVDTDDMVARQHFAVAYATVHEVDWLELHPDGHRRARFAAEGPTWLMP